MIDDPYDMAFQDGLKAGRKSLVKDVIVFLVASSLAIALELKTYQAGVTHGMTLTIASDYLKKAVSLGYAAGIAAAGGNDALHSQGI